MKYFNNKFGTFINEKRDKESRKKSKAGVKLNKIDRLKRKAKELEAFGKTKRAEKIREKIAKLEGDVKEIVDKFNDNSIDKKLKVKLISKLLADIKLWNQRLKRQGRDQDFELIKLYRQDYDTLLKLQKAIHEEEDEEIINQYVEELVTEKVIESLKEIFEEAEDKSEITADELGVDKEILADKEPETPVETEPEKDVEPKASMKPEVNKELKDLFEKSKESFESTISTKTAPSLSKKLVKNPLNIVRFIQTMMFKLGHYQKNEERTVSEAKIDGQFGPNTANAVKNFQKEQGIDADGIIGTNTWKKILDVLNIPYDDDFKANVSLYNEYAPSTQPVPGEQPISPETTPGAKPISSESDTDLKSAIQDPFLKDVMNIK